MEQRDQEEVSAVAADDLTAGNSLGSAGGTPVGEEPDEPGGIDGIVEGAKRTGWGRPGRDTDQVDDERAG